MLKQAERLVNVAINTESSHHGKTASKMSTKQINQQFKQAKLKQGK